MKHNTSDLKLDPTQHLINYKKEFEQTTHFDISTAFPIINYNKIN